MRLRDLRRNKYPKGGGGGVSQSPEQNLLLLKFMHIIFAVFYDLRQQNVKIQNDLNSH